VLAYRYKLCPKCEFFIHEIGHAIDYKVNGNVMLRESNSKEFKALYEEESQLMEPISNSLAGYAATNEEEYFAEAFQQYILFPENLQQTAPETYAFMKEFVAEL
jgi:Mlc titration factor MtfA (ptsG expression regulator)